MKHDTRHVPVLLHPVLDVLNPRPGQVIVDCTLGLGGHSAEILKRLGPAGRLIGIDFDPANIAIARARLNNLAQAGDLLPPPVIRGRAGVGAPAVTKQENPHPVPPPEYQGRGTTPEPCPLAQAYLPPIGGAFDLFHNNFAALRTVLTEAGVDRVDGVLADLGVASPQIDDPARGFSYRQPGPLDMRMDPTRGQPASALVNRLSERELASALLELGDETDAPQIARLIVERRARQPIVTTQDLMAIVCQARDFTLKRAAGAKLHPAARTFQALRILVNRELANLDNLLRVLPSCLKPGGVAAIISFHSGEDRRVKAGFRAALEAGEYAEISDEPIIADEQEQKSNPRSRSAKLRWARSAG